MLNAAWQQYADANGPLPIELLDALDTLTTGEQDSLVTVFSGDSLELQSVGLWNKNSQSVVQPADAARRQALEVITRHVRTEVMKSKLAQAHLMTAAIAALLGG